MWGVVGFGSGEFFEIQGVQSRRYPEESQQAYDFVEDSMFRLKESSDVYWSLALTCPSDLAPYCHDSDNISFDKTICDSLGIEASGFKRTNFHLLEVSIKIWNVEHPEINLSYGNKAVTDQNLRRNIARTVYDSIVDSTFSNVSYGLLVKSMNIILEEDND